MMVTCKTHRRRGFGPCPKCPPGESPDPREEVRRVVRKHVAKVKAIQRRQRSAPAHEIVARAFLRALAGEWNGRPQFENRALMRDFISEAKALGYLGNR